jgi:hypothetical protein
MMQGVVSTLPSLFAHSLITSIRDQLTNKVPVSSGWVVASAALSQRETLAPRYCEFTNWQGRALSGVEGRLVRDKQIFYYFADS